ncbi:hypothetical protein IMZ48_29060 [Candidatus Bathyarchaeota archaeon]|nr:hypothetical protein [Candidatus Bathyarchaeota archaeon]
MKDNAFMRLATQLVPATIGYLLLGSGFFKGTADHRKYSKEKVRSRMEVEVERPDFLEGLLKKGDAIVSPETNAVRVEEFC